MGFPYEDGAPFWKVNEEVPDIKEIKKHGLCCTGLANLIRRYLKLQVPGSTGKKYSTVIIEKLMDYSRHTRYTHVCLPENWLLKIKV